MNSKTIIPTIATICGWTSGYAWVNRHWILSLIAAGLAIYFLVMRERVEL